MTKPFLTLLFGLFISSSVIAQIKHDSVAYYMLNKYDMAHGPNDAQFLRLIIKKDSGMFEIQDYYPDGKPRLLARSLSDDMNFESGAQGMYTEYFKTGNKMVVRKYDSGKLVGDDTTFYSNGQVHNIVIHDNTGIYLKTFIDSTGKIMTDNGNGNWIKQGEGNGEETWTGSVVNGKEDGTWLLKYAGDTATYHAEYKNGVELPGTKRNSSGQILTDQQPSFPGGDVGFGRYLSRAVTYPGYAREHHITGRVIITFYVEQNGSLSELRVLSSPDESLSKEALRAMSNCPVWKPGLRNGLPVRVRFSMPVAFSLSNE